MTALALHFPKRSGAARWVLSAAAIVAGHVVAVGVLVLWYTRTPPEPNLIPAIAVSLAPAAPVTPAQRDEAVAEQAVTAVEPDPPKVEEKPVEKIIEPPPPEVTPPPQPAQVVLPKPPPKPIEKKPIEKPVEKKLVEKKPVEQLPRREERDAAASREAARQSSVASSNAYNSLVYGHVQRFKHYPAAAGNVSGQAAVRFVLNRAGSVLSSSIARSSGNSILDQEALAIVQRASPFPPFPAEKSGTQDSFIAPISFAR